MPAGAGRKELYMYYDEELKAIDEMIEKIGELGCPKETINDMVEATKLNALYHIANELHELNQIIRAK